MKQTKKTHTDAASTAAAVPTKNYLSVREAADFLDISRQQIYALSYLGVLPKYRPSVGRGKRSGRVYFKIADLEKYIERGFIPAK